MFRLYGNQNCNQINLFSVRPPCIGRLKKRWVVVGGWGDRRGKERTNQAIFIIHEMKQGTNHDETEGTLEQFSHLHLGGYHI